MTDAHSSFRTPFTRTPGGSTPSPEVSPEEGRSDLYAFVLLSALSTAIIAVVGIVAFLMVR